MSSLPLHALVALLQDVSWTHFETGAPLLLRRGQIGTIVLLFEDGACAVEFADKSGRAYALLSISPDKLMGLHDEPESAAA
jgi:hypothetical protein